MNKPLLVGFVRTIILITGACMLPCGIAQAAPLAKIENCTLIKTDWADGDSFPIQLPEKWAHKNTKNIKDGKLTVRLYGADCIESVIRNDTDARRLRAQRRYFGITEVGGSPMASIKLAKEFGAIATKSTSRLLAKPFTIYTSFANARGNAKSKRVYAFVLTADGEDIAAILVANGLARAFGVSRETFDKRHRDEYKANLADLELQACRNGIGIWKHTNWKKLPLERKAQRDEEREIEQAIDQKQKLEPDEKIHINKASIDELMKLPSIGEAMANRIIEGRPYRKQGDLLEVDGIGPKTLEKLKPFLIFPADDAKD